VARELRRHLSVGSSRHLGRLGEAVIGSAAVVAVTIVAYIGIRVAAWVQWALIAIEYIGVTVLAVYCLVAVFGHHPGSVPFSANWFSWGCLGGVSGFIAASLIAVICSAAGTPASWSMSGGQSPASAVGGAKPRFAVRPAGSGAVIMIMARVIKPSAYFFTAREVFQPTAEPRPTPAHHGDGQAG
jgi:amino acid transporter